MTERKFYRTVFTIEVLSEEPLFDGYPLDILAHEIVEGDCSGRVEQGESEELDGAAAAKALIGQDSDPSFFRLDEDGNDSD